MPVGDAGDAVETPSVSSSASPATDDRTARLILPRALRALELIDAGSLDAAARSIDALDADFSRDASTAIVRNLLHQRLRSRRRAVADSFMPPEALVDPDRAAQEFAQARLLFARSKPEAALPLLERAYSHDPYNNEIADALVSLLKKKGLNAYSRGDVRGAVSHWRRILEVRPEEAEAVRFLRRAKAVVDKGEAP